MENRLDPQCGTTWQTTRSSRCLCLLAIALCCVIPHEAAFAHDSDEFPNDTADPSQLVKPLTLEVLKSLDALHGVSAARKDAAMARLSDHLSAREQVLLALMEGHPATVLEVAVPVHARRALPPALSSHLEHQVAVEGTMEVSVADDFTQRRSTVTHLLRTDQGERILLHFVEPPSDLSTGTRVRVRGVQLREHMALGSSESGSVQTVQASPLAAPAVKKVAVILFNFQNNPTQPYAPSRAKAVVFTDLNGVNEYYKDVSFGKLLLQGKVSADGDVFGWYTIPYSNAPCDYSTWASAARNVAAADGFSLTGYQNVLYAFPQTGACSWWGLGNLGGSPGSAWVNGSFELGVVGHELGHNFSLHHSSSLSCTDGSGQRTSISPNCARSEYGDPFDIMGSSLTNHVNMFQKGRLNVLDAANTQEVTSDGLYAIAPMEYASTGTQVLRIPRDVDAAGNVTTYYYVEFRQPAGQFFDNFSSTAAVVHGVLIHLAPPYATLTQPLLIDATPSTGGFDDAALPVGATFQDPIKGISVTTKNVSSSGAAVQVTFGGGVCAPADPLLSISPSSQWAFAGQTLPYTVTLTNQNSSSCPAATFAVSPSLPSGWSQSPSALSLGVAFGAAVSQSVSVTSAQDAQPGFFTIVETATNTADTQLSASASATYAVQGADTTPPTVSITNPTDGATVTKRVTVTISASDNVKVTKVDVAIDGNRVATDTSAPYRYSWYTRKIAVGAHTVSATAFDAAGNSASALVTAFKR